ncbi:SapC family protein [Phenylobacterium deserti]|uniref:Peptidase n=1 Tax=Phenylobacterium deserti TaxID=1914756 RepID=A0A328AVI9_9CAUL|nr:SapC family protein [Phenylobacterium deserti]RAK57726.1 peptidase [Phenylobacterium deserti]
MTTTAQPGLGQITGNVLFYSRPEPLTPDLHKNLGVNRTEGPFKFAKAGHAIPLTVGEFPLAAVSGPIIFVGDEKLPLAVMGLNAGENMFVRDDGLFEPGVYVPAYVRRYPFVFAQDNEQQQLVLCVDRAADFIGEKADLPFFNADGSPSDYTKNCIEFCNSFEMERQRTMSFVQLLKDLDLFETKTSTFTPTNPDGSAGQPQMIAEYFGVSEEKLNALPAEKTIELRDNGALAQIYAHLLSLVGWDRLIAVALARQVQPTAANA